MGKRRWERHLECAWFNQVSLIVLQPCTTTAEFHMKQKKGIVLAYVPAQFPSQLAASYVRMHEYTTPCSVLGVWLNRGRQRILEFQQINTP